MYSLNKMRRPLGHLRRRCLIASRTTGILSYPFSRSTRVFFMKIPSLLDAMSKLLNVQFHIVTKDFSYALSSTYNEHGVQTKCQVIIYKRLKTLENYQLISSNQWSRSVAGRLRC